MKRSKHSLALAVVLGSGALAWLSPLPATAGDNVWTNEASPGSLIAGVAVDPSDARTIYAVSGAVGVGWIFKSVDGGANWTELGGGDPAFYGPTCLAVDPANPSNVYVGTENGIVANSHDAGASWSKVTVGGSMKSITVEPLTGSVYAATRASSPLSRNVGGGLLSRSTDGGRTWSSVSTRGLGKRRVYAMLADSLQQTLLVGTDFAYSTGDNGDVHVKGGGVARTTDGGASWTLPATDLRYPVTALAADPSGGLAYAGTSSGEILRSADAGASWTHLSWLSRVEAIVVDPSAASTLYAATAGGVWRSIDGGTTWRAFESGLYPSQFDYGFERSLAIDPTGRVLYAGTPRGVFRREIPVAASGNCQPGADHLCLLGSRFRVDLRAIDPRTQASAPPQAIAQADRFGYFSFPTLTGDPSLPEVFVKMLDATSLPGQGYWLFSSGLTDVPYSLAVTDTATGRMQLYDGQAFCGTADTQSFPPGESAVVAAGAVGPSGARETSGVELALLSRRFRITLSATDPSTGTTASGAAIPQGDRFGYFSLPAFTGDASFPEVFVKMLDATSLPDGDFWLFQAGLTTLPYTLTVTDSRTGAVKTYTNNPSDPTRLCGSADTHVTAGAVTEFPISSASDHYPDGIAAGPDGNLWFTETSGSRIGRIGRITTSGVVKEYPISKSPIPGVFTNTYVSPYGITAGPDGNLWFTELYGNKIGRITPSGVITEFSTPTVLSSPAGIAAGPDGNLWFTEYGANQIGRITTAGVITEFPYPAGQYFPHPGGIAAGPDGNLWFTDPTAGLIGRITTSGVITEFPFPEPPGEGIAAGPDGNVWFTGSSSNQSGYIATICRITTTGVVTVYPIPTDTDVRGIAAGPDGNLWFTELWGNKIGRITTAGVVTEYPIPKINSYPGGIAAGPDGSMWFTESSASKIGRITALP